VRSTELQIQGTMRARLRPRASSQPLQAKELTGKMWPADGPHQAAVRGSESCHTELMQGEGGRHFGATFS
jgi:hypothetical protein